MTRIVAPLATVVIIRLLVLAFLSIFFLPLLSIGGRTEAQLGPSIPGPGDLPKVPEKVGSPDKVEGPERVIRPAEPAIASPKETIARLRQELEGRRARLFYLGWRLSWGGLSVALNPTGVATPPEPNLREAIAVLRRILEIEESLNELTGNKEEAARIAAIRAGKLYLHTADDKWRVEIGETTARGQTFFDTDPPSPREPHIRLRVPRLDRPDFDRGPGSTLGR